MPGNQVKFAGRNELIVRELLAGMLLTLVLVGLALLLPLGYSTLKPENTGVGEITAPWLIIWLQVLLRYLPPFLAGVLIPLASLGLLAVLPWLPGAGRPDATLRYHPGLHLAILLALWCTMALLTFWGL
jgi:quinol-cytochrome oxidoreductase complex cytochrome b subunit